MFRPERFLKERFGFGVLAYCVVQRHQIIEACRLIRFKIGRRVAEI